MKNIRVEISDDLHRRLKLLCDHHGDLSHIIRRAIKNHITEEEIRRGQAQKITDSTRIEG